LPENLYKISIK